MKKIIEFIKNTRISSRVLLIVWLMFSVIASGFDPQEMKSTFPVFAVFFLFPAALNEFRKNQVFNSAHKKVKALTVPKKIIFIIAIFCLYGSLLLLASSSIVSEMVYGSIGYALISLLLFYFAFKQKHTKSADEPSLYTPYPAQNKPLHHAPTNSIPKINSHSSAVPLSEYALTIGKSNQKASEYSVTHNKERIVALREKWESGGKQKLSNWRNEKGFGIVHYDEDEDYLDDNLDYFDESDISFIDGMEGHTFEYYCADLLKKNNFVEVSVTRGSGDQGVDVLATKDGVKYAIQCKNYSTVLSNKPVQEVLAGKFFYNCHVAVVMTNSTFTPGAQELAKATGVLLWDRTVVQEMMGKK